LRRRAGPRGDRRPRRRRRSLPSSLMSRIVVSAMQSVSSWCLSQAARAAASLAMLWIVCSGPALALDLFARHQVTVQFATSTGKPMAHAEVRVFAPGEPNRPALTGRTDSDGKFEFAANEDG